MWFYIFILLIVLILGQLFPVRQPLGSLKEYENLQTGGSRAAIFSRFYYEPQFPFISKLDDKDLNVFSKIYNTPGPLKIMMGRPYRYYTMAEGNWGYPWHFPGPIVTRCFRLAADLCEENIGIIPIKTEAQKRGGLFYENPREIIHPSKCFDSVYYQCKKGIDPLLIRVADKGVYDYNTASEQS
jgi:hypothetical protein